MFVSSRRPELLCSSVLGQAVARMCHATRGTPLSRCLAFLRKEREIAQPTCARLGAYACASGDNLLPSHLPPAPEYLSRGQGSRLKSARSRARLTAKRVAWAITEMMVACFGFWELDSPKTVHKLKAGFGSYRVTSQQTQAFLNLYSEYQLLSCLKPGDSRVRDAARKFSLSL